MVNKLIKIYEYQRIQYNIIQGLSQEESIGTI